MERRLKAPAPNRRRVLVVTPDALTLSMGGPAIRALEISAALSARHDVHLASTTACELSETRFPTSHAGPVDLRQLEAWCEVAIVQGTVTRGNALLRSAGTIVVVDLYDPVHLELLAGGRGPSMRAQMTREALALLKGQMARGDFFLCASQRQRDLWMGHLAALGRLNPATYDADPTLESLIAIVPFGIGDRAPVPSRAAIKGVVPGIGADDKVLLWGGGVYEWFDPLTLVQALDLVRRERDDVRLVFMGMQHPNPATPEAEVAGATRELASRLGLTGRHVFFLEGWVPYGERADYLMDADVGVSTHHDHLEARYSYRTRVLDYVWASVPIVTTGGDAMAALVEARGLGVTVPPGDVDALAAALALALDEAEAARFRRGSTQVAPELRWSRVLDPLLRFVDQAHLAPDRSRWATGRRGLVLPGRRRLAEGRRLAGLGLAAVRDGEARTVARHALARRGRSASSGSGRGLDRLP